MKLVIDTRNGIAGDIVNAGLIGLGADKKRMISSMEYAGNHIGKTKIKSIIDSGVIKLKIKIETDYGHFYETKAKEILANIINDLGINNKFYSNIIIRTLDTLCKAERYVHCYDKRLQHMLHYHHHDYNKHNQFLNHKNINKNHFHHRKNTIEAVLHEAKDILIDVIGLCIGLEELNISQINYLNYINAGNGFIKFSHGNFKVPAPATECILNKYGFVWKKSNINEEMTTPTGVSILAGTKAKMINSLEGFRIRKKVLAKGERNLSPISFYLIES